MIQNGGNSGVGRNLIAFARDRGLKTVSLVRREELVPELKAAGGDVVLVDGADAPKRIAEATRKAKIRLAVDGVAGESFSTLSAALAPGGKLVTYGGTSGKPAPAEPHSHHFQTNHCRWLMARISRVRRLIKTR